MRSNNGNGGFGLSKSVDVGFSKVEMITIFFRR